MSTEVPFTLVHSPAACSIGSLRNRILAFVVDGLILYVIGRIVGAAFFDRLSMLGQWGCAFGFVIALIYFVPLESRVGGGQTLGKRLFRLRVVNAKAELITWKRAALRYTICAIPFFISGPRYTMNSRTFIVSAVIIFIKLGVGGALIYLVIFNRTTRQGLHDVAAGTYIVESSVCGPLETKPISGLHWWAIGGLWLLIAFICFCKGIATDWHGKFPNESQNLQDERQIANLCGVRTSNIRVFMPIPFDSSALGNLAPKERNAIVTVQWDKARASRQPLADQVAAIILQSDPRAQREETIQIRIGGNYDLAISSGNDYQTFVHTPEEWRQRMSKSYPVVSRSPQPNK